MEKDPTVKFNYSQYNQQYAFDASQNILYNQQNMMAHLQNQPSTYNPIYEQQQSSQNQYLNSNIQNQNDQLNCSPQQSLLTDRCNQQLNSDIHFVPISNYQINASPQKLVSQAEFKPTIINQSTQQQFNQIQQIQPPPGLTCSQPISYNNLQQNQQINLSQFYPQYQQNFQQVQQKPQQQAISQSNNVLINQQESYMVNLMCKYNQSDSIQQKLQLLNGNIIKLAINQTGSKFLQKVLDQSNPQIVNLILNEIDPHMTMLMMDNYGNYFFQRLLLSCSAAQRIQILNKIQNDFIFISCNKKGTHAIQKFIDLINIESEDQVFQHLLTGNVVKLSLNSQGYHIISNILKILPENKAQYIFDEIYQGFIQLAFDGQGLSIIKIIIEKTTIKENKQKLLDLIVQSAIELAQNPFGNYVLQAIYDLWDQDMYKQITPRFYGKIYQLSIQKCSSNVIDKCIQKCPREQIQVIIQEIIECDKILNLIMINYGSFVLQNALKFANDNEKAQLGKKIGLVVKQISDQKIRMKWKNILKRVNLILSNFTSSESEKQGQSEDKVNKKNQKILQFQQPVVQINQFGFNQQFDPQIDQIQIPQMQQFQMNYSPQLNFLSFHHQYQNQYTK